MIELEQQPAATEAFTFTLVFPRGYIAILEVRGAATQESARAFAEQALPMCQYIVRDGDQTNGHAEIFYLWCNAAAQEQPPHHSRQNNLKEGQPHD
jgi:hypothetical protein